jgi:hypothetical protein
MTFFNFEKILPQHSGISLPRFITFLPKGELGLGPSRAEKDKRKASCTYFLIPSYINSTFKYQKGCC